MHWVAAWWIITAVKNKHSVWNLCAKQLKRKSVRHVAYIAPAYASDLKSAVTEAIAGTSPQPTTCLVVFDKSVKESHLKWYFASHFHPLTPIQRPSVAISESPGRLRRLLGPLNLIRAVTRDPARTWLPIHRRGVPCVTPSVSASAPHNSTAPPATLPP